MWLAGMDNATREEFVDSMYALLCATNARTLTELNTDRKSLLASLRGIDPKSRDMLVKLVLLLADQGTKNLFEKKEKVEKKEKPEKPEKKEKPEKPEKKDKPEKKLKKKEDGHPDKIAESISIGV